jgi:serine/threonine-protein kinase
VITLTLLHPIQSTPVQNWTFEHEPIIRIGRSTDNHVILYSAVVSRHHVELRRLEDGTWELFSLGANGTYLDSKQITKVIVADGVIIRLARSGPNIQIHLGTPAESDEKSLGQRSRQPTTASASDLNGDITPAKPPKTEIDAKISLDSLDSSSLLESTVQKKITIAEPQPYVSLPAAEVGGSRITCSHQRAEADMAFCPDCGQPLQVVKMIGNYQVIKTLSQDRLGMTQLLWQDGRTLLLKTLNPGIDSSGEVQKLFKERAEALLKLDHPAIPRFIDYFFDDRQSCLVIEKVYGHDLYQTVATKGVYSESSAIDLMLQLCDALTYLHHQSPPVLHLDLRPENLVIRTIGAAKEQIVLTGFVSLQTLKMDTQSAVIGYQAPEQQQGHATAASDLFALGPILVYLLTGKEPGQFYAHREQGFRFYPEYVPGLSTGIASVVRRLTTHNPEERYGNAEEVITALGQVAAEKL